MSKISDNFYVTVGLAPAWALEPFREYREKIRSNGIQELTNHERDHILKQYFKEMDKFIENSPPGKIIAIGKCGLDYDRLDYADKTCQLEVFKFHFNLAEKYNLPMYFYTKSTGFEF